MKRSLASSGIHDVTKRYGDFLIQSGINAMKEILQEEMPDAVFCANDYMAVGAIKLLSEPCLQVPRDISVIGYDNNVICQVIVPSLTTVDHRLEELGRCLGLGLLGLIEGTDIEVRKSIMPVIVECQSRGPRPTAS
jgi:DNA-binding LacI/PurR family transcriptional regulator